MSKYLIVDCGDNDYCESLRKALEKFSNDLWRDRKEIITSMDQDGNLGKWLTCYFEGFARLQQNPDMYKWTKLPDTDESLISSGYFDLSDYKIEPDLSNLGTYEGRIWENSEVGVLDLDTGEVTTY